MKNNIYNELMVLDIANNHFGDVEHAKKIVDKFSKIIKKYNLNAAFKFQFRDLETFIHKDSKDSGEKYVKRFMSTKLSLDQFAEINNYIKKKKIKTACTPFDENSIQNIEKLKFDYLKIASVSALDFNIHERAIKNKIPKIISTGGLKIDDIDKIVSFYIKKKQKFALMHCISIYPSDNKDLHISFIKNLKKRYKDIPIGWSTHELPEELNPAVLAYSCGARIFEKHIGIKSKKYKLNNYSITPELFEKWYENFNLCKEILGDTNKVILKKELLTLRQLERGVYAKSDVHKGDKLTRSNTYFAFPLKNKQLSASEFKNNIQTLSKIEKDGVVVKKNVLFDQKEKEKHQIYGYIHKLKAMLNYNNINISENVKLELSHHKGIKNFEKVGCFLFNVINEEYAKKILVMLPNQQHPSHHHKIKKESFIITAGNLKLNYNGKNFILYPGQIFHIKKNSWHKFKAGTEGCIFEEISTTSFSTDSYYENIKIKSLKRNQRKTFINNWFTISNIISDN